MVVTMFTCWWNFVRSDAIQSVYVTSFNTQKQIIDQHLMHINVLLYFSIIHYVINTFRGHDEKLYSIIYPCSSVCSKTIFLNQ